MNCMYRIYVKFVLNLSRANDKNVIPHMERNVFLIAAFAGQCI